MIKSKGSCKIDFIVDFPDILTRNLNEPITSPTYFTGNTCEQFIIDFANNSFIFDIIDFFGSGNFLSSQITFLNQNSEKSKNIKFKFLYSESYKSHSQHLPISIREILDQKNGWLFDNSLKCQILVQTSKSYSISHLYPVSIRPQSKCRLIIPISLFSQYEKEKIINLNPIQCYNLSITPFIVFSYNNDNRLIIQTNFKIYYRNENELFNFISFYENKDQNHNAISIFANIEANYAQMNSILLEKNLDESDFVFEFNESKKVLYLDIFIQHIRYYEKESSPGFLDHFIDENFRVLIINYIYYLATYFFFVCKNDNTFVQDLNKK